MKKSLLLTIFFLICYIADGNAQNNKAEQNEKTQRIMSYNIQHARGMDSIVDIQRIGNVIKNLNSEIVALQEVDSIVSRSGNIDTMKLLAKQLEMYDSFSASIHYKGGKYGNGILTKEKPIKSYQISLPGEKEARSALIVELNNCIVISTHFSLNEDEQLQSAKLLNEEAKKFDKPVFLMGDFNAYPDSKVMKLLKKKWKMLNNPDNHTFPSDKPNVTIDYIMSFKNKYYNFNNIYSEVIIEPVASDHRPVFIDVDVNRKVLNNNFK